MNYDQSHWLIFSQLIKMISYFPQVISYFPQVLITSLKIALFPPFFGSNLRFDPIFLLNPPPTQN